MGAESLAFRSTSVEATEALGEALGRRLGPGAVVALSGDLGAGKTAFVRGLARGLEVTDTATSPTFTLMQEHAGRVPFFHFDAWMAGRETAFLEAGGIDYLGGDGVAAVEWAERVSEHLPVPRIEVRLRHLAPEVRGIELRVVSGGGGGAEEATDASRAHPGFASWEALLDDLAALGAALEGLDPLSASQGEPPGPAGVGRDA